MLLISNKAQYICAVNYLLTKNSKVMAYTIAKVSDQVQSNFIAWSIPVDSAETIEEAQAVANLIHREMVREFESRPDFGNGAIMGESVIIHDGEQTF